MSTDTSSTPLAPPSPKKSGGTLVLTHLYGAAKTLCIATLAAQASNLTVVISETTHQAYALAESLKPVTDLPVWHFPDWEILPYDRFSPHQDIISERLSLLQQCQRNPRGILIIAINTLMHRLPPKHFLMQHSFVLKKGDVLDRETLTHPLAQAGYRNVSQVMEHGEFALRGGILDVFPMGSESAFRIDFFDDEVDSIRTFDPETQRSDTPINAITVLPAHEFPLTEAAITHFRQTWRELFPGNPLHCTLYQDITEGVCPAGIEYYLPLFFEETATIFDYLPENTLLIQDGDIASKATEFWTAAHDRYTQLSHDITRPILSPAKILLPNNERGQRLNAFSCVQLHEGVAKSKSYYHHCQSEPLPDIGLGSNAISDPTIGPGLEPGSPDKPRSSERSRLKAGTEERGDLFHRLKNFINKTESRILFTTETAGRREVLLTLLQSANIRPQVFETWDDFLHSDHPIGLIIAPWDIGCTLTAEAITIIPESQLLDQPIAQRRQRKQRRSDPNTLIKNLAELQIGMPVVHLDHGIGRYCGLKTITLDNVTTEFLTLSFANDDKLYVPISSLELISRYTGGDAAHAPLDRLGTDRWQKSKRRAHEKICDVAADLLAVYAEREVQKRQPFALDDKAYQEFASQFPFEETIDQTQAISQVLFDLTHAKTMDRLICGDVGFGKTEVAMRAAFLAVQNQKQVAILVPTTLLAQQHGESFQDRFADWPIRIEVLSRFKSAKEQKAVMENLASGKTDIVIGTHKLLNSEIRFFNLGLLIIDEEHRFGVKQKEKIKQYRANVDILAMTATPIPRTLNMAMHSVRDLSIIATPPEKRLSIKTFVQPSNNVVIKEAIRREMLRGGQVYYLHNKVETIDRCLNDLQKMLPDTRMVAAHGQMRESELEKVMTDFYHQRFHVLVCTTIIETGIDVPSANTIIIDRADKFGLSQLHQLRGRVGRSHHQAYAYLLTPHESAVSKDAEKRLEAISTFEDLGAGFILATHDLEIRGAGELLGEEQSGHIESIGFSLYMDMLEKAVKSLKNGETPSLDSASHHSVEINLKISALIPEDYLPDVHARLSFYKRIACTESSADLDEIKIEMIDRFGPLPVPIQQLFEVTQLKQSAHALGIKKLDAGPKGGLITFIEKPRVNPGTIIKLIQVKPKRYQLSGKDRLRFTVENESPKKRTALVKQILEEVSQ